MNVIQEANTYAVLIKQGVTKAAIQEKYKIAQGTLNARLVWLELPAEVQQLVAEGKLPSSVRVAKALTRLPEEIQVSEAQRLSQSEAKIEAIEQAVDTLVNQVVTQETNQYGSLSDGRPFLAVTLAERSMSGAKQRTLSDDAVNAARRVCELCSLQPNMTICQPCPLVMMLAVLLWKK